jgi:regulator of nucleoside diphosphate kinase
LAPQTKTDHGRLTKRVEIFRERHNGVNLEYLDRLEEELDRVEVVEPKDIPPDVITMRSTVRLNDLSTGEEMVYWLAFPTEANYDEGDFNSHPRRDGYARLWGRRRDRVGGPV